MPWFPAPLVTPLLQLQKEAIRYPGNKLLSWLLSCKSLWRKGKKLRKPIQPLCGVVQQWQDSVKVMLQGCLTLIFILSSLLFTSSGKMVNTAWKYYSLNRLLAHTGTWNQKLLWSDTFKIVQSNTNCSFIKKNTKKTKVITFKALKIQKGEGND